MTEAVLEHDWFPRPLPTNVVIGPRSWLVSSYAFLHYRSRRLCGVRIGHDSGVYRGTFFELGPRGEVEIGDFCTVVAATISCNSRVVIGDYALISHDVVLADRFAATPWEDQGALADGEGPPETSIVIGTNCWIGARAVLLAGAVIGDGAIVGAAAVVDSVVPPNAIVAGNPARVVGSVLPKDRAAAKPTAPDL
jgi:acetyltransferase-like isoleucine patch superfamily enzyme